MMAAEVAEIVEEMEEMEEMEEAEAHMHTANIHNNSELLY